MSQNLLDAFVGQVGRHPQRVAAMVERRSDVVSITWQHLAITVVNAIARLEKLVAASNAENRRVIYASHNGLADLLLALACPALGAVEVPIDHRLGDTAIDDLRRRSDGLWLDRDQLVELAWASFDESCRSTDPESAVSKLEALARQIDPDEAALVLWTSGTTGDPKGVVLSHANLFGNAKAKLAAVPQSPTDVRLTTLPLCHAYARTCDLGTWLLSGCQLAVSAGFEGWNRLGVLVKPTLANTVPSLADRLLSSEWNQAAIEKLRLLGVGGAAMRESDFLQWKKRGTTVIQGYGLTESGPVICSATPENARPGRVGTLVQGWESDIRGGHLFVRGPHVMLGYLDDPIATAQRIDDDGWLDTGDIVDVDQACQQYRVLGRADDTIVLDNGRKVHPAEIERRVETVPGVRHAMLMGDGRTTSLWIDATETDQRNEIQRHAETMFCDAPSWQRPREIGFFDPPLSASSGEITRKGALCRAVIRERRFSSGR